MRMIKKGVRDGTECWLCFGPHRLMNCEKFKEKTLFDKKEFVEKEKLCYNCLAKNHYIKDCVSEFRCRVDGCNFKHHIMLHDGNRENKSVRNNYPVPPVANTININSLRENTNTYLQVVPVIISNGVKSLCANALLDSGSDSTFISHDLANSLHLRGTNHSLEISNAISATTKLTSHLVNFEISSTTHPKKIPLNNIWVVKELNLSLPNLSLKKEIQSYPHLKDINFPKFESSTIDILIGADIPSLHFHHDIKMGKETDPVGILTQLGWVIMGGKSSRKRVSNNHISLSLDQGANSLLRPVAKNN